MRSGHGIEGEARAHLRDAPGALGHHDKVDDEQDHEYHHAHDVVAADHHFAEGLDHMPGRALPRVAVQQHDTGRGHVQRQAHQGSDEQDGREHREIERPHGIDGNQQHDQRQRDVEGEEDIQQQGRDRQNHHREKCEKQHGNGKVPTRQHALLLRECAGARGCHSCRHALSRMTLRRRHRHRQFDASAPQTGLSNIRT
jgi:hypothetical protein